MASGRQGVRATIKRLKTAQKPGYGAPPYSRFVNRRFGRFLAAVASSQGLTPNQVTVLSGLSTLTGIVVIIVVPPAGWQGFVVCALLVLGYALDAADGQLARVQGGGSLAGEWLDHVVDATKNCLLHTAVLISLFRWSDLPAAYLLVPLGYQAVTSVFFFTFILVEKLRKSAGKAIHQKSRPTGRKDIVQSLVATPTDYGVLCLTFLAFGWTELFLGVYSLMFIMSFAVLLAALTRWWRELKSLDASL